MKNYLIYPTKKMYISQSYTGSYSHKPNVEGTPKDFPIDESCGNSGRDYFYCPCDEMIVKKIYGVGAKGTNTIWLQSTKPVVLANGKESFVTIMVIHPNDDTLKNIKTNQRFKRKEKMFLEGTDGNATGNHFHISISASKYESGGWQENNKKAWVIKGKPIKPEEAFWVDTNFTTISNSRGLKFKNLPKYIGTPLERDKTEIQIEVIASELRARKRPNGEILGYINKGFYNILNTELTIDYTWYEVEEDVWIATKDKVWTILHGEEMPKETNTDTSNSNENTKVDEIVEEEEKSDYEDLKTQNNALLYLIDLIVEFFKKIFKRKK